MGCRASIIGPAPGLLCGVFGLVYFTAHFGTHLPALLVVRGGIAEKRGEVAKLFRVGVIVLKDRRYSELKYSA